MTLPRIRKARPPKRYGRRSWSMHEDEYLAKWYNAKPVPAIARALKRTTYSVSHRACRIGLVYVPSRITMTAQDVAHLVGLDTQAIIGRISNRTKHPIPHHRVGRWVEFSEADVMDWLNQGHVLCFDRAKIDPRLHRMYDAWRERVIGSAEILAECPAVANMLRIGRGKTFDAICVMPINSKAYLKSDAYAYAYQWGHLIQPTDSPRFHAIRAAWDTEYILKYEVNQILGLNYACYHITKHCPSSTRYVYKRSELVARLVELGHDALAKRWRSTPVPWQEMMYDYERTKR